MTTFSTQFAIRVSDINYGGHLGNDRVLSLFHETRVRWLSKQGWNEANIDGVGIVQTEAHLRYRAQAFLGENLSCSLEVTALKSRGFTLSYKLSRDSDGAVIADGSTVLRFFDYESQSIASTPSKFSELYGQ